MSELNEVIKAKSEFDAHLWAVAKADGRFDLEAYKFVYEALHHTVSNLPEPGHVTARELLEGIRDLAKEKFGLLTRTVFESWRVSGTGDFGEIVFALVSHGLMGKTEDDRREDFDNVYEFKKVFDDEYLEELGEEAFSAFRQSPRN